MEDNAGVWSHMIQDGLGSVRLEASDAEAVNAMTNFAPYGQPFGAQGTMASDFGFTGEQTDDNGQVFLRARYYNPGIGLFNSLDPFEGFSHRPLTLNGYSWVEGNVANASDPTGLLPFPCNTLVGGCALAVASPFEGPVGDIGFCTAAVTCIKIALGLSVSAALAYLAQEITEKTGYNLSPQVQRSIEEALDNASVDDPAPEGEPTYDPNLDPRVPFPAPNPDQSLCPTNHPPGSSESFARGSAEIEMEDIMCNILKHTAQEEPNPYRWWHNHRDRIYPQFADAWAGTQAAFLGRRPRSFRNVTTRRLTQGQIGAMFIPRPGTYSSFRRRTRADIMAFVVHELRHAGQFYGEFENETVRGQFLSCANISARIAEVDAWRATNHWILKSSLSMDDFSDAINFLNGGRMWTEDELWDHHNVTQYRQIYQNTFDAPPYYTCPDSMAANVNTISC